MHIALFLPAPLDTVSGAHIYDRRIAEGLRAAGHQVELVPLAGAHPLADDTARAGARSAFESLSPDTVAVIDGLSLAAFAPAALARPNTVGLIHHPISKEPDLAADIAAAMAETERALLPRLPRIVVTSTITATALEKDFAVDPARLAVVVPGTDPASRSPGSGGPTCHILSIGTLLPRKGHDLLLRALAKLFDLDWHLTIAGEPRDPVHAGALHALAEELNIARRVTFEGVVTGAPLEALWQRADLFALATQYEGYGMAIAEALKRGLPVAVTNGGAAGALVAPECGAVCEVGDLVQFSKSLRHLIFDTALREDMAAAALKVGAALPDWPTQSALFAESLR